MISVITGDIINSRRRPPESWLGLLKEELKLYGNSPVSWETYKGDTFQFRVDDPLKALLAAIKLKAAIKMVKPLDVRLAIGIGDITYQGERITESNGPAFINSGEKFSLLKKEKLTLAIKTPWLEFDATMNLCLRLGMIFMDNWSLKSAEVIHLKLFNPQLSQEELGQMLGNLRQNAVSNRLARAHYDELKELNDLYQKKIMQLL